MSILCNKSFKPFRVGAVLVAVVIMLSGSLPLLNTAHAAVTPVFVQEKDLQVTSGNSVSVTFPSPNAAGNLIVAYVIWDNSGSVFLSDTRGNTYIGAISQAKYSGDRANAQVFYAKNVAGGGNSVTATFATAITSFGILYIHEYSGIDQVTAVDVTAAATGSASAMNSGSVMTLNANDLLFGAAESGNTVTKAGTGYTSRSTAHGNMTMDRRVTATGSYNATATQSGNAWIMQMVAFRVAGSTPADTTPPSVPTNLTATAVSTSQINLSWTASTDNVGVTGYKVYRGGTQIATVTSGTIYQNTGLSPNTTYSYTVAAYDAAGNTSAQSAVASATTQPLPAPTISSFAANPGTIFVSQSSILSWTVSNATSLSIDNGIGTVTGTTSKVVTPATTTIYTLTATNSSGSATAITAVIVNADTQAPTIPTNLAATVISASQINLSWTASSDNVSVSGYNVYRNGSRIAVVTSGTSYQDTGLTPATTYTYTVSAYDAAGNTSGQSSPVSATTSPSTGANRTYTTSFPLTENPISENGNWINGGTVGLDWCNIATTGGSPGLAYGTETGSIDYNDSTALLTGTWGPDQTVQATVYTTVASNSDWEEVELRVRSSLSAHNCTGYEINFSADPSNPYVQIVRWNGPLGSWTELDGTGSYGAKNGDVIKATISGSTVTAYINGNPVLTATDSTYSTGSPGMGFYVQGVNGIDSEYGFTSFTATDGSLVDTQAPTIPTNLSATAVSSSQIDLSWTPSTDNVGVVGYKIFRNGLQVGTSAIDSYSDTGLSASTTYTYTVSAYDAALNNSGQSDPASATTLNPPPPGSGLAAAYNFDEGTGTLAHDLSGNANTGTLTNGPTWTTGKYGTAISFNGVNNYVLIPNSSSLDISGQGLTIEFWANITNVSGSDGVLFAKPWNPSSMNSPYYQYGIEFSAGRKQLDFYLGFTTMAYTYFSMTPALASWTHVAFTYDGAAVKGYLNGVQQFSTAETRSIQARGNSLRLGVDGAFGQPYLGELDDIRIYNRALTQSEIQTDMNTPVN